MQTDITVVMAFKDSAQWLPETLDSLARQKPDGYAMEVLLVDDCSRDEGGRVAVEALTSFGVRHRLIEGPGEGPAVARNLGLQASISEWVQFLDSDDILHPLKLSEQWRVARVAGAEVAVVYSPWASLVLRDNAWVREPGQRHAVGLNDGPIALARSEGFVPNGSQIFRRNWIERAGGYDATLHPIEDVGLQIRIAMLNGRFVLADSREPLFLYRRRRGSFSTSDRARFHRACHLSVQRVESFYREKGPLPAALSRELAQLYLMQARFAARHDPPAFAEVWKRIQALDPRFVPAGPPLLRRASRLLGYPQAERLAIWRERWRTGRSGGREP